MSNIEHYYTELASAMMTAEQEVGSIIRQSLFQIPDIQKHQIDGVERWIEKDKQSLLTEIAGNQDKLTLKTIFEKPAGLRDALISGGKLTAFQRTYFLLGYRQLTGQSFADEIELDAD